MALHAAYRPTNFPSRCSKNIEAATSPPPLQSVRMVGMQVRDARQGTVPSVVYTCPIELPRGCSILRPFKVGGRTVHFPR